MPLPVFRSQIPIRKGWSCDEKYCVTTEDGTRYLLRITPKSNSAARMEMFRMQQQAAALGIPMCRPVAIGECDEGIYQLQTWVDGQDAEEVIPYLADSRQYALGLEAGRILKTLHTIPAPPDQPDWEVRFNAKMDRKIQMYRDCPVKYDGGEALIDYINHNRHLLHNRPQCYQHGDYHIGNMMIEHGKIVIIDFDRYDFGDPWEEFNRIVWAAQKSPLFASGMVNGYFGNTVPMEFWQLLALYISSNTLSSLPWAIPFGESEVQKFLAQGREVLTWYDNMKRVIPSWYFEGYYLQSFGDLPYKLRSPFDFSFLDRYGTVFQVFDDQDSGNICFGTQKDGQRYFIKFAGAPTEAYTGTLEDAVARLRASLPVYRSLRHKNLIELIDAGDMGGGFALIFRWADGDCMGRMYPAARQRFLRLPLTEKQQVFSDVLDFFVCVAAQGYVAIDFYDGSILYDFEHHTTTICDIDFFRHQPCVNDMGRMWGSSRFQSPEEYQLGAVLDEITNVYTVGATAFELFANGSRTRETWPLNDAQFYAAQKAVSDDRSLRQQSILQFKNEWELAGSPSDISGPI